MTDSKDIWSIHTANQPISRDGPEPLVGIKGFLVVALYLGPWIERFHGAIWYLMKDFMLANNKVMYSGQSVPFCHQWGLLCFEML